MSMLWKLALTGLLVTLSGCQTVRTPPASMTGAEKGQPVLFLADPQFHNLYGLRLKQMSSQADWVSRVAIRPPELNILAPLVFDELIGRGLQVQANPQAPRGPAFAVVVGDSTNIACTGEFATFQASIGTLREAGLPILVAHGNHDSYLLGTVNNYKPMTIIPKSDVDYPTDTNIWANSGEISSTNMENWRDGCFQPAATGLDGSPMTKERWLAKYIALLGKDVVRKEPTSLAKGAKTLVLEAAPNSSLSKLKYRASGRFYPRREDALEGYKSYIVQALEFDDVSMIIIDTSVCPYAGGLYFRSNNAGQHSCIGDDQFETIKHILRDVPKQRKLVIVGHFPLADWNPADLKSFRDTLLDNAGWVYVSAHTHEVTAQSKWFNGTEINIASTTDWPMQVNNIWFGNGEKVPPTVQTISLLDASQAGSYQVSRGNEIAEVCRHLPVAKALAELFDPSESTVKCDVSSREGWDIAGAELHGYMKRIMDRYRAEKANPNDHERKYTKALLDRAAAASLAHSKTWALF